VQIAVLSTIVATALGTLMALALVRYSFRGRAPTNFFIFLPLATPEVVLGAALLSLFLSVGFATGFWTILIAHVMFNISFVVVTVRSRLIGFDRSLEEAAQDLGATGLQTFRLVTLPLIAPGVLAAALLAFALSVDDFVITNFNAGQTSTFPLFIYGAARQGVPPQVNVIATALLCATALAGCGEKSEPGEPGEPEPFTLALDFFVNPDHAGIYTAIERGYFEQAGLEVEPQVPSDPSAPIRQVAAGRADLAISYEPEVLLARDQDLPVVAVAALVLSVLPAIRSRREVVFSEDE